MDKQPLDKIQYLDDLELTLLAALVANEHCLFSLSDNAQIGSRIASACRTTFGLEVAICKCDESSTIEDLNDSIVNVSESRHHDSNLLSELHSLAREDSIGDRLRIPAVVLLEDLDLSSDAVQVQVIELLKSRRIFSRSAMHTAPKNFMLIVTTTSSESRLSYHLNDMIAVSSFSWQEESSSISNTTPFISQAEIDTMRQRFPTIRLTAEVDAYLYDIILFMRMNRYVQGGISASATRHLRAICRAIALLHGIEFITPSIVMLAVRKVYPHRIQLASATTEMSLQWGSEPEAVQQLMDDITIAEVIEDVISSVQTPL